MKTTIDAERGSALIIALLVTFILSLLGVSFLLMAQTETRIARNEKNAAQATYLAEAGARAVQGWFDRPGIALGFPGDPTVVDRALREVLDETDPYAGAAVAGAGLYKQYVADSSDVDLDGDGGVDLFDRPYRGGVGFEHALMGSEEFPDMRIEDPGFLDQLSETLFGSARVSSGQRARLSRIDVYAPPYVAVGGNWSRYGMGTVKVTASIYRLNPAGDEVSVLAEQSVTIVLNEIPYATPVYGPTHACGDLSFTGDLDVHWGPLTSRGDVHGYSEAGPEPNIVDSLPRQVPPGPRIDRLWAHQDVEAGCFDEYTNRVDPTESVRDPWLRVISRGQIVGAPATNHPVNPGVWPSGGSCDPTSVEPLACCDRSNLFQDHVLVLCPEYDYEFWKNIALAGRSDVHYYVPDGAGEYLEYGVAGDPKSFAEVTGGAAGLFFFDTTDQLPPRFDDDGVPQNLSQQIDLPSDWRSAGFIFLNAVDLVAADLASGATVGIRAPGEPYHDANSNRRYDAGETWINLAYPAALDAPFHVDALDNARDPGDPAGPDPVRNAIGPVSIDTEVSFSGILYNSGDITATGTGVFYGSVIARGEVRLGDASGAPEVYWDDRIPNEWPPADDFALPRVTATRWTDEP